tara:strand:- start:1605 stop:1814 length:210 start_codon:yes stop_codon:yes gene_type:complete
VTDDEQFANDICEILTVFMEQKTMDSLYDYYRINEEVIKQVREKDTASYDKLIAAFKSRKVKLTNNLEG